MALVITIIIILSQILIVHFYMGIVPDMLRRFPRNASQLDIQDLILRYDWLCHSYNHLNKIMELAEVHHVKLVLVDPDFLSALNFIDSGSRDSDVELSDNLDHKAHQGPGQTKTIIHLAAINETSGGQPNIKSFYKSLRNNSYVMLKYDDTSQTMPHEVYRRPSHQFDDVQFDAIRDLNHIEREKVQVNAQTLIQSDFEISKIYTEFVSHILILNTTQTPAVPNKCTTARGPSFVVIHIFVLYNYEYRPQDEWIQSSLHLDGVNRHKLLTYGVHSNNFKVPLEHYYTHPKRDTLPLAKISDRFVNIKDPLRHLSLFEPRRDRTLEYANNTYLHCRQSSFNITGLIDGNRKMSNYLKEIDWAKPPDSDLLRHNLEKQMSIALDFMKVFSRSYGNFSFWITGSSLLAYHKFCQLVIVPLSIQINGSRSIGPYAKEQEINSYRDIIVNLEVGTFASEINQDMLLDLSGAKMIGVTMITDWQKPDGHISFRVEDCPSLIFHLYQYKLKRDFYQHYFVTKNNLIFNHKFRRKQTLDRLEGEASGPITQGHHVFSSNNLKLCWTRIDRFHPFRVPCDVHDHLRRIFVV